MSRCLCDCADEIVLDEFHRPEREPAQTVERERHFGGGQAANVVPREQMGRGNGGVERGEHVDAF